jgi:hypothetical protein
LATVRTVNGSDEALHLLEGMKDAFLVGRPGKDVGQAGRTVATFDGPVIGTL